MGFVARIKECSSGAGGEGVRQRSKRMNHEQGAFALLRLSLNHSTIRKMERSMNGQVLECESDSTWPWA
jgi:hypothetical protein